MITEDQAILASSVSLLIAWGFWSARHWKRQYHVVRDLYLSRPSLQEEDRAPERTTSVGERLHAIALSRRGPVRLVLFEEHESTDQMEAYLRLAVEEDGIPIIVGVRPQPLDRQQETGILLRRLSQLLYEVQTGQR